MDAGHKPNQSGSRTLNNHALSLRAKNVAYVISFHLMAILLDQNHNASFSQHVGSLRYVADPVQSPVSPWVISLHPNSSVRHSSFKNKKAEARKQGSNQPPSSLVQHLKLRDFLMARALPPSVASPAASFLPSTLDFPALFAVL